MSNERAELQREFKAYWADNTNPFVDQDLIVWLQDRRTDARDDWRRLRRRVAQEGLNAERQALEEGFLAQKYNRYYGPVGIPAVDGKRSPWDDARERNTTRHPDDDNAAVCPIVHCQRPMPTSGSSLEGRVPPQCGVCGTNLSERKLARERSKSGLLFYCDNCGHDICIHCGRSWIERRCECCERVVGVPPTEKLAGTSMFCCWVCEADQTERRLQKKHEQDEKGGEKDSFKCGQCHTSICLECGKPSTFPFAPDYGLVRNLWYKYLRRERRLGIPQFDLEDLYTPAHAIEDDKDDDMTLYDGVAPKRIKKKTAEEEEEEKNGEDKKKDEKEKTKEEKEKEKEKEKDKETSKDSKKTQPTRKSLYDTEGTYSSGYGIYYGMIQPKKPKPPTATYKHAYKVRRVDFGLEMPPPQGFDDFWYAENNKRLYNMATEWSEKFFAKKEFPVRYDGKTWLSGLNEQFINYANIVAHEDPFFGPFDGYRHDGWEYMLKDRSNRKWLIVSVLAQIIEKKIFVELLFGATPDQAKKLDEQDSEFLDHDGYRRAAARSQLINLMMGRRVVPHNFYQKVDELTSYTAKIFQDIFAITNLLDDGYRPRPRTAGAKNKFNVARESDIAFMYAELHYIISHAAYLAVCMRRSASVFHILSATPAARMDYPIESQANYDLYKLSKDEADRLEKARSQADKDQLRALKLQPTATYQDIAALEREQRLLAHHRLRGAKVKFAVWPMITRYRAENVGNPVVRGKVPYHLRAKDWTPPTADQVEGGEGQRVVEIGKCVVVYYQGVIYPRNDLPSVVFEEDGRSLLTYLAMERSGQTTERWRRISRARFAARLLGLALLASAYAQRDWVAERWVDIVRFGLALPVAYTLTTFLTSGAPRLRHATLSLARVSYMACLVLLVVPPLTAYLRSPDLARLGNDLSRYLAEGGPSRTTMAIVTAIGLGLRQTRTLTSTMLYGSALFWALWWCYTTALPQIVAQLDQLATIAAIRMNLPWAGTTPPYVMGKVVVP
ncbi:hypothetical protein G7054_g3921 [Neopestalotiopsis clavispora]|nr:hypothetical protein G7054_g3921 [Neopestalotiopsis clavispora]